MNVVGIGTDIVECDRIANMIEKHQGIFVNRVFTPYEIEYCSAQSCRPTLRRPVGGQRSNPEIHGDGVGKGYPLDRP